MKSLAPSRAVRVLLARWPWVVLTPLATVLLSGAFLFLVTPRFEAFTSLRIVEDEAALGGTLSAAPQGGAGGFSLLASLAGRGVPLQTEMAVLASRGLSERLVEDLGLRAEVASPARVPRSSVLAEAEVPLDGPEGHLLLVRGDDGRFRVTGKLLAGRDPFRLLGRERYVSKDLGTVEVGDSLPLAGVRLALAAGAKAHERIEIALLSPDEAIGQFEDARTVTRPQREADVVQVAVRWSDPGVAAEAANRLAERYLAYREELRVERARRSARFLARHLDSLRVELERAEESLRRFREARDVVAPDAQVSAELTRLSELKARRDLLDAERRALARLVERIGEPGAGERELAFFPGLLQGQATAELLRLLAELETQRALLLERRTTDAAGVQLVTARIRELEAQLRAAASTYLRGLDDQVRALDAALRGFEAALEEVPAVEMEYARLGRQVELLGELALFLETRRAEAELNAAKEGVGAYVLARARAPEKPASPRPLLTLALALLVGVVLGAVGVVAAEQAARSAEP